jgi:hypothetical protein
MDGIDVAQGTEKWRDLVNEIMKYRVLNMWETTLLAVDLLTC